jgi:Zn-dependent metalloprotease
MSPVSCAYRCAIIPPHIIDKLRNHPNADVRRAAEATRFLTYAAHVKRTILAQGMRPPRPTGTLRRTIYDGRQTDQVRATIVRSEGQPAVDDTAVNEAYEASGDTYNFYRTVFGRNSVDGNGLRLDSTVHYREDPSEKFDNAEWDGEEMLYGDGDGVIFGPFTKSLDVIGHELTHGVTQYTAGLEYHDQPGALNESMSDVFGTMVRQWKRSETVDTANWLIGAELFLQRGLALRSLKAPGTAYTNVPNLGTDPQPGTMAAYVALPNTRDGDNGGVHINSGIPNRAFYLACTNLGAAHSWEKAGKIWYKTLTARLTANASFADAAQATTAVANELGGADDAKAVRAAWDEVGVHAPAGGL